MPENPVVEFILRSYKETITGTFAWPQPGLQHQHSSGCSFLQLVLSTLPASILLANLCPSLSPGRQREREGSTEGNKALRGHEVRPF